MRGDYVYLASDLGMAIVNVADPATPNQEGLLITPSQVHGVVLSDNYGYLTIHNELLTFDLSKPTAPRLLRSILLPGAPLEVAIVGKTLYVTNGMMGLHLFDITDPASPTYQSSFIPKGAVMNVAISGNYAYLANAAGGMDTVYVKNRQYPIEASSLVTLGAVWDVKIVGDYAFVGNDVAPTWTSALTVLDVSHPTHGEVLSRCMIGGSARDLTLSDRLAYLPAVAGGLNLIDISDPLQPFLSRTVALDGLVHDVCCLGDFVYVTGSQNALYRLDLSKLAQSVESIALPTPIWHLSVVGNYAFGAAGAAGLQVLDVRNPLSPTVVAQLDTPGNAVGLTIVDQLAYVADGEGGCS